MYLDSLFLVLSAGKSWLGIDRTDGMRYPKELHTLTTKRNRPFFFLSCARVRRALLRLLDAVPHDCAGPSLYTLPKGPEAIPRHVAGGAGNACFEPLCAKNDQITKTGSGQTWKRFSTKRRVFPQVLRLMGISRSPIFALFSRTLRIRDTLRAFAAQRGFEEEATELVERNSALYLTRMLIGFWTQNSLNLVAVGLGTKNRFR